jgi:hypothetical protein
MRVRISLPLARGQLKQSIPESVRILRGHEHGPGVVPDRLDKPADRGHDHRQPGCHGYMQRPRHGGTVVGQHDRVGPGYITGELFVADIPVDALDQVGMRATGNGLVRDRPFLPRLAQYRQAELAGLITVEHAERGHQIFHPLEGADDAEI